MYSIGAIASLLLMPMLSDPHGRRLPIIVGSIIMIVAASVQTAAVDEPMFEGSRFFMGFGNTLAQLSAPVGDCTAIAKG